MRGRRMTGAKPWWQSVGVVGGVGSLGVGIAQIYSAYTGNAIDIESIRSIIEDSTQSLLGLAGIVTGIISIYGRIKAFRPVKKPSLPWLDKSNQPPKE